MSKPYVTLKMIAQELGISVSTVSRALNDSFEIREEVKLQVINKAKQLGYKPNMAARSLRSNSSNLIGVIVPDLVSHFYSTAISGIEKEVNKHGFYTVIMSSNESLEGEISALNEMTGLRVSGLIMCLSQETEEFDHLDHLASMNLPTVFFDRVPVKKEYYAVVSDDKVATYTVTKKLLEKGLRKIAFIIGPRFLNITSERLSGYAKALEEAGLDVDDRLIIEEPLISTDGNATLDKLLGIGVDLDAVICINDVLFYDLLKALRRRKDELKTVPELIGYIDEFHSTLFASPYMAIAHQSETMGMVAAQKLFDLMNNRHPRHFEVCPSRIILP